MTRISFIVIFTLLAVLARSHPAKDEEQLQEEKREILEKLEETLAPIKKEIDDESWKQIVEAWKKYIEFAGTDILRILLSTLEELNGDVPDMFQKLVLLTMVKQDIEADVWDKIKPLFGYELQYIDQIVNVIEVLKEKITKELIQEYQLATIITTYKEIVSEDRLKEMVANTIEEIKGFPEVFDVIPISSVSVRNELRQLDPNELKSILAGLKERLSKSNIKEAYRKISILSILSFIRSELDTKEILLIFREVKKAMVVQENVSFPKVLLDRISARVWTYFLENFENLFENQSDILKYIPVSILIEVVNETLGTNVADNMKGNLKDKLHEIPELTEKLTVATLLLSLKSTKPELWEDLKLDNVLLTLEDQLGVIYVFMEASKSLRFRDSEDFEPAMGVSIGSTWKSGDSEVPEPSAESRRILRDPEILNTPPEAINRYPNVVNAFLEESDGTQSRLKISPEVKELTEIPELTLEKVGNVLKAKLGLKTELLVKKIEIVSTVLTVKTVGAGELATAIIDYVTTWRIEGQINELKEKQIEENEDKGLLPL